MGPCSVTESFRFAHRVGVRAPDGKRFARLASSPTIPAFAEPRPLSADGLRSRDAFVLRRCQIVLASARGERAPRIAAVLGFDDQTVRLIVHVSVGGTRVRIRLSNAFGDRPLRIRAAHIAITATNDSITMPP